MKGSFRNSLTQQNELKATQHDNSCAIISGHRYPAQKFLWPCGGGQMEMAGSTEAGGRLPRRKVLAHLPLPSPHLARESSDRGSSTHLELLLFTLPAPAVAGPFLSSPFSIGFWYLQKFSSSSLRLAKLWAKTFLAVFEVPKPQVLPREVFQQCAAARQRMDGKEKQEN